MDAMIPPADPVPTRWGALKQAARVVLAEARLRTTEWVSGRRPTGPRVEPLPRTPAELTPQWLTGVLCRGTPGARVTQVVLRPARMSSGTTTRSALQVSYNEAGTEARLPRALFIKCTSSLPQRLMLGMGGLIGGEPGFYEFVRPRLRIEAPAGHFGAVDPGSWRSVVLMEDVASTRGARFCGWDPLSRSEVEDLLTTTARWHGTLWESPDLSGRWRWLRTPAEQAILIESLIGMADRTGAGTRRAEAVLPAALRGRRRDLFEGMRRSLTRLGDPPHTYLHGDLHPGNTYVTSDGRLGVCDWQVGLRGGWAHDVGYLLITALSIENRRACERELLEHYLERLADFGGRPPALDEAWAAYRQATLYPYFAWIYTLGRSRLQPRFQASEMAMAMIARIANAIEDLDSLGAVGL